MSLYYNSHSVQFLPAKTKFTTILIALQKYLAYEWDKLNINNKNV